MRILKTSDYIEAVLYDYNQGLSTILNADILLIRSPIRMGLDDLIRIEIDALTNGEDEKRNRLAVLIETTGGYIEVVERIYRVFRKHYKEVDFIVPNYAYSAGTVLVMSGDNIYMDYYSVLGPIDPQMENSDGQLVPGLGYLAKFDELMRAINNAKTGETRTAELAYLIKKFDPALLFSLEQAKEHSVKLLEEWLPRHKFKNWKTTQDRQIPVTDQDRKDRARKIAEILGSPQRWNSHGRGITINELSSEEIKLQIENFGTHKGLADAIYGYYNLFIDYCQRMDIKSALHSSKGLRRIA